MQLEFPNKLNAVDSFRTAVWAAVLKSSAVNGFADINVKSNIFQNRWSVSLTLAVTSLSPIMDKIEFLWLTLMHENVSGVSNEGNMSFTKFHAIGQLNSCLSSLLLTAEMYE